MASQTTANFEDEKIIQLIVFHVDEEEFGVPIQEVREIIKAGIVTPVPDSPDFIRGLINVRGDIVATIDLRARFGMRTRTAADSKHTIITKQKDNLFGLMVDEVTEVLRIPEAEIKKTPELVTSLRDDYVSGVLPLENRLIVLLDLALVLSPEELARLGEVSRREPRAGNENELSDVPTDRVSPNQVAKTLDPARPNSEPDVEHNRGVQGVLV